MTLDTNVYNNSNVLSCKIDKTAPELLTYNNTDAVSIGWKDSNGVTKITLLKLNRLSGSQQNILCGNDNWNKPYNTSTPVDLQVPEMNHTSISSFCHYLDTAINGDKSYCKLRLTDIAGNNSEYEITKIYGSNATYTKTN